MIIFLNKIRKIFSKLKYMYSLKESLQKFAYPNLHICFGIQDYSWPNILISGAYTLGH
jgi:hypothetical protein